MAKWRMTYNNRDMHGCSARGVAIKESKEELELLAKTLQKSIYNVQIKEISLKINNSSNSL